MKENLYMLETRKGLVQGAGAKVPWEPEICTAT